jgi:nicotinate-nucleotide adenylyltransferase
MCASVFERAMNIGLYFGSFNPIHTGHMRIAQAALQQCALDCVWFMISPQNPFKETGGLAPEHHRYAMVELACAGLDHMKASDFEFSLPRPSFTITAVLKLKKRYPDDHFSIILGEDNLQTFHLWKDVEHLLQLVNVIVYPRTNATLNLPDALHSFAQRFHFLQGNLLPVSATEIRTHLKSGQPAHDLLHPDVLQYIRENKLYSDSLA